MALNLKPTHKVIKDYYNEILSLSVDGIHHEGAVSPIFSTLLRCCASECKWKLIEKQPLRVGANFIIPDGTFVDNYTLPRGYWEAKDIGDDIGKAIKNKFSSGYPKSNIIFQRPDHVVIYQDGSEKFNGSVSKPEQLIECLQIFFDYQPPIIGEWEQAVGAFKNKVKDIGIALLRLIEDQRITNKSFIQALEEFTQLCRDAINPNISIQAVEEMLIQHLLTERLFMAVFNEDDFVKHNVIAKEIEKVILALTSQNFSRHEFLKSLDHFYIAIEKTAARTDDFAQKQGFINTVYQEFFQGFSLRVADTHGIVYTPQPIVKFMVKSIGKILQNEFGYSFSDDNVHIIDPFVGTGSFILWIMREIQRSKLEYKYTKELHCNEVMLLPYYIASMNIEHEYYTLVGKPETFQGICLVDTFDLVKERQLSYLTKENTDRVKRQQNVPIFVVVGNPPYNSAQVNENDNNKNRKYKHLDKRVKDTYAKASNATLLNKLYDPYVKAFRWASDRISEYDNGIVSFVTNNSFVDQIAFDGMRKHLAKEFNRIYVLDLGGNVRKNPKLSGTTHNVFGIQVGVSINFLIKRKDLLPQEQAKIFYANVGEYWRKEQKYAFLDEKEHFENIGWQEIYPDTRHNWLTEGMQDEFNGFLSIGTRKEKSIRKQAILGVYSNGVNTARDKVVYNFNQQQLLIRLEQFCDDYNTEVMRYHQKGKPKDIDSFVSYEKIKWSSTLKNHAKQETLLVFDKTKCQPSLYRPFTKMNLYYDHVLIDRPALFAQVFPNSMAREENRAVCTSGVASSKPFQVLMVNTIPCFDLLEKTQCFPLYTYPLDGSERRENVTDWILDRFQANYHDGSITKQNIFNYTYAVLHHPHYQKKYATNLKKELPHIPFVPNFWGFAEAGEKLSSLHTKYEEQPKYPVELLENKGLPLNWRVGTEAMKLSKDKTQLIYNDFFTLTNIPSEVFEYRLGGRSALEWIIDQYHIKTDKRSGIVSDPNQLDNQEYILDLIARVITVSLETVKIVKNLPQLE